MAKIKYPPSAIKRCDKKLKQLLQEVIDTKRGGTTIDGVKGPARVLNQNTGDLRNRIKPVIKVKGSELHIDMEVVKYYQYLDTGTSRIKNPWFLTEEFTNHDDFIKAIEELTAKGLAHTMARSLKMNPSEQVKVSSTA
jgi:hypothetical protein